MGSILGVIGFILFIGFGVAQLAIGFMGIEHDANSFWAWTAVIAALGFRFTLPITIGSFFGALNVLGWHWSLAALFAAPGLLFVIPGMLVSMLVMIKR